MNASAFSIVNCSNQDFYTKMGAYTATLLDFTRPEHRASLNKAYGMHAENVRQAMGYRAEHDDELSF